MGRGPRLEQIEGGDYPTFRVEASNNGEKWVIAEGGELLTSDEAIALMRRIADRCPDLYKIRIVNERTGFTRDERTRENRAPGWERRG